MVCTIDPDDAKYYYDAIILKQLKVALGAGGAIADVSHICGARGRRWMKARERGNSTSFPG